MPCGLCWCVVGCPITRPGLKYGTALSLLVAASVALALAGLLLLLSSIAVTVANFGLVACCGGVGWRCSGIAVDGVVPVCSRQGVQLAAHFAAGECCEGNASSRAVAAAVFAVSARYAG